MVRRSRLSSSGERHLVSIDAALQQQIDGIAIVGLPDTIQLAPGCLTIRCRYMEHLVKQLVLVQGARYRLRSHQLRVENASARKPVDREQAARSSSQAG